MRDYKLYRFNEAESRLPMIPYFDSDRLEDISTYIYKNTPSRGDMDEGIAFRKVLLSAVKRVTDDFTDGDMFTAPRRKYMVGSAEELLEVVNENSGKKGVYIQLTGDIDMSQVIGGSNYFAEALIGGILDGQGYRIYGLNKPLFKSTQFSVIYNVILEGDATALLSKGGSSSVVYDCKKEAEKVMFESGNFDKNLLMEYFSEEP